MEIYANEKRHKVCASYRELEHSFIKPLTFLGRKNIGWSVSGLVVVVVAHEREKEEDKMFGVIVAGLLCHFR